MKKSEIRKQQLKELRLYREYLLNIKAMNINEIKKEKIKIYKNNL